MILPIGDHPNPRGFTPWATYGVIAVNVMVFFVIGYPLADKPIDLADPRAKLLIDEFLARGMDPQWVAAQLEQLSQLDLLFFHYGYRPAAPSVLSLVTSMFLHGSWMHLLGNMLFLWIYGDNVEYRLGRLRYLLGYLATGVIATLLYAVFTGPQSGYMPLIGASGAISGILGFYFVWFPRNDVRLLLVLVVFVQVVRLNARLVLGFYLLIENLLPLLLQPVGASGVAHGAHIGGFFAGACGAFLVQHLSNLLIDRRACRKKPSRSKARESTLAQRGISDAGTALPLGPEGVGARVEAGDMPGAVNAYLELLRSQATRVPPALVCDLGDWARENEQPDLAFTLYRRAVAHHPRGPALDRLYLGMALVLLHHRQRPTSAYQFLVECLEASPSQCVADHAKAALLEIESRHKKRISGQRH